MTHFAIHIDNMERAKNFYEQYLIGDFRLTVRLIFCR
jgi:predicted enzyme related to lactoylglutathione lyase